MRAKLLLPIVLVTLLMAISQGCAPPPTPTAKPQPATATTTATATATAKATATATPTATGSGDAPRAVPAGNVILNWTSGNHNPQLALDGQGQPNLFFETTTAAGGAAYTQAQLSADGTWTKPAAVSPEFQFLDPLTAVPDMSGRLCVLWSGEMYDTKGNTVYGLFRNCQQADGAWLAQAQQAAVTSNPAAFSPARAPDGSLQSVFVTAGGSVPALFYSPIANKVSTALTGTQLSGSQQVLLGRLAIDSNGGYHAAWTESTGGAAIAVLARYSKDGGKTWAPAEQLYAGTADNPARIAFRLLADPVGQVHLAWDGENAIFYRRWTAAGGWGESVKLSGAGRSAGVALAVSKDGLAQAAWTVAASKSSVMMRGQTAGGAWGPAQTVSPTRAYQLSLAVDARGTRHVIWQADDGLRYLAIP